MKTSEQINELAGALAKAQGVVEGALKDTNNTFFRSKYADLASVWDACRKPLSDNGLCVVQFPKSEFVGEPEPYEWTSKQGEVQYGVRIPTKVSVLTRIAHSSGQWMEDETTTMLANGNPQAIGSAITYLRRYALQSVVGVAPEDDDAETAEDRPVTVGRRVDSGDRPVPKKAGIPPCPGCDTNAEAIVSKKGPGFYCFKCKKAWDPVREEALSSPEAAEAAAAFT